MPRLPRVSLGNYCYHIINRANARLPIFFKEEDYILFEEILREGQKKYDMRLLAYTLMPNHFHLVLYPKETGDLQRFMQWITLTHTQRWHREQKTIGTGHLYQGRYKSFIIEKNKHLLSVIKYVERNPLRAKLVRRAENWKYGSLYRRLFSKKDNFLSSWPIEMPKDYLSFVNAKQPDEKVIHLSVKKGRPYGRDLWVGGMIKKLGLEATIRPRGRPKKGT